MEKRGIEMNEYTTNLQNDLTITPQGFGLLRKALIENIGEQRANFFYFASDKNLAPPKQRIYSRIIHLSEI